MARSNSSIVLLDYIPHDISKLISMINFHAKDDHNLYRATNSIKVVSESQKLRPVDL
jgi:hypothetical protein